MFKILSLDGGGIRGAFGIGLLSGFEERLGHPVTRYFDLIAGTSTGSITGACLCAGMSADDVRQFYDDNVDNIFRPREQHRPKQPIRLVWPLLRNLFRRKAGGKLDDLFRSRYCPMGLKKAFLDGFGGSMMSDLDHGRLIVPSVNLTRGKTVVFRTPHLPEMAHKGDVSVVDVLLASTAAPTYFPHHTLPDGDAYCDGGLWAVSPALLAVAEAIKIRKCEAGNCSGQWTAERGGLDSISLLSVGAGEPMYSLTPPGSDAGALYWSSRVAEVMGASQVQGVEHPLKFTLGDRYQKINFEIPDASWSLDAIEHREVMHGLGVLKARECFDSVAEQFFQSTSAPAELAKYEPSL